MLSREQNRLKSRERFRWVGLAPRCMANTRSNWGNKLVDSPDGTLSACGFSDIGQESSAPLSQAFTCSFNFSSGESTGTTSCR